MKLASIFDLITASNDLLEYFEQVESPEQLISRLERLKRTDPEDMANCILDLRMSIQACLDDTLEVSASMPTSDDTDASVGDIDEQLKQLTAQLDPDAEPSEPYVQPATPNAPEPSSQTEPEASAPETSGANS